MFIIAKVVHPDKKRYWVAEYMLAELNMQITWSKADRLSCTPRQRMPKCWFTEWCWQKVGGA